MGPEEEVKKKTRRTFSISQKRKKKDATYRTRNVGKRRDMGVRRTKRERKGDMSSVGVLKRIVKGKIPYKKMQKQETGGDLLKRMKLS